MTVTTMVRPAIVPYRWPGFGIDLRAYLDTSGPLFFAVDVCAALAIEVPAEYNAKTGRLDFRWPSGTTVFEDVLDNEGRLLALYRPDAVIALAHNNVEHFTPEFLTWFEELAANLSGEKLIRAIDSTIAPEPGRLEETNHAVAKAARILSADKSLSFTRDQLFAAMHTRLDWINRMNGIWIPTSKALKAGYVVRQHVWLAGIKSTYPQIRVTTSGLERLHALLGGTEPLNPAADQPLTLVEPIE